MSTERERGKVVRDYIETIRSTVDLVTNNTFRDVEECLFKDGWVADESGSFSIVYVHKNYDFVVKFFNDDAYLSFLDHFGNERYCPEIIAGPWVRPEGYEPYVNVVIVKKLRTLQFKRREELMVVLDQRIGKYPRDEDFFEHKAETLFEIDEGLLEMIEMVECFAETFGMEMDLAMNNIMVREDDTIVLSDPVYIRRRVI